MGDEEGVIVSVETKGEKAGAIVAGNNISHNTHCDRSSRRLQLLIASNVGYRGLRGGGETVLTTSFPSLLSMQEFERRRGRSCIDSGIL